MEVDVEAVDVVDAVAAVVAVAANRDPVVGPVLLDDVGAGPGEPADAFRVGGRVGGTAQKNGIVVQASNSPTGRVKVTASVLPRATTPDARAALPAWTSSAPTIARV